MHRPLPAVEEKGRPVGSWTAMRCMDGEVGDGKERAHSGFGHRRPRHQGASPFRFLAEKKSNKRERLEEEREEKQGEKKRQAATHLHVLAGSGGGPGIFGGGARQRGRAGGGSRPVRELGEAGAAEALWAVGSEIRWSRSGGKSLWWLAESGSDERWEEAAEGIPRGFRWSGGTMGQLSLISGFVQNRLEVEYIYITV